MNTDFWLGYIFGFLTTAMIMTMLMPGWMQEVIDHIKKILKGG